MTTATLVAIPAAMCSVSAFVPQAYKILKTRNTKDLSRMMWILQVVGFALWIAFGVAASSWPLIVENSICFLLSCFILGMKLTARGAHAS